jgi:predicted regulator of amino acid metabolism with ACT domain
MPILEDLMARGFNHERAAMVLCDAVILGDRKAADKWDISLRTICNWRDRLENDEKLRNLMQEYREKQTEKWLEDMPIAMSAIVQFFLTAAQELSPGKADDVNAVVAVFEALADVELTRKIIAQRLKID